MELAKLTISKITSKKKVNGNFQVSTKTDDVCRCQFNPTEFELTKMLNYKHQPSMGQNVGQSNFKDSEPQSMTLTFLFDSTDDPTKAVIEKYKVLRKLINVEEKEKDTHTQKSEPPWVLVQWGKFISFPAVLTRLTEKFTLFRRDGAPLRASVTVTLQEIVDISQRGAQNPTTQTESRKTWIVRQGQRLDWIAYEEYGDSSAWRHIAETNGIGNPLQLQPGRILKLTPIKG